MKRAAAAAIGVGVRMAGRLRPGAAARPPAQRSVLDDIAMRRPWNLRVKAVRLRARVRPSRLVPGVTVVIVNWNTREVIADTLEAVQRLSPEGTGVLVVDNGSVDGSREMLASWSGIRTVLLDANPGHGVALDLGVCAARTTLAVTLDSDALPLSTGWLEPAVAPVRDGTATLAGLRSSRDFVHPVYLAIDVRSFVRRGLSFQVHRRPDVRRSEERWGVDAWDTGELLTHQLARDEVVFIEQTSNTAPGLPGMTVGGVVYHHGGVSRSTGGGLTPEALAGWRDARRALELAGGPEPRVSG